MLNSYNQFLNNFNRIAHLMNIYNHLSTQLRLSTDETSDLLRSMVVYAISALDRLIHDLVKAGMLQSYLGARPKTPSFLAFALTMDEMDVLSTALIPEQAMENIISKRHKTNSFQEPDKISQALSLIWNEPQKWQAIAAAIGSTDSLVKTKLRNVVSRRNQIVHEADIDPITGDVQEIHLPDVVDSIDFIRRLGDVVYNQVR